MPARFAELRNCIDDVCSQASALLNDSCGAENAPKLARTRWRLTKALSDYHAFVLGEFCGAGAGSPSDEERAKERVKADCHALNKLMQVCARAWSSGDNHARWEEYRPAALHLLTTVQHQLTRNDDALRDLSFARSSRRSTQAATIARSALR